MFSVSTIKRSIGCVSGIIGILCYIFAYWKFNQDELAYQILINIADVLVIGVVVGYLSSVAQWSGVFKRDIQDIIFGKKLVGERKDIEEVWSNVTKQLLKNKFSEIHRELLDAIRISTIPNDDIVSYYEDYDSDIQLVWVDQSKGIVKSIESISFTLIADSNKEIKLPIKTSTICGNRNDYTIIDPSITVDGNTPKITNSQPTKSDKQIIHTSIVHLSGKNQYQVSYTREKTYNIHEDYYIGLKSQFIVRNLTVSLHLPDNIDAIFIERGAGTGFTTVKNTKNCIKKKLKGVIFPKQGYIFALKASATT